MKRILIVAAAVLLISGTGFAQGIATTAHDFSGAGWNTAGEICQPCHTPHGADLTVATAPLWNHELTTNVTFGLYSSPTLDATMAQPVTANGISRLCLSCHDGTVSIENFGGVNTGTATIGTAILTLASEHPIAFTYNDTLASTDGGLHPPTSTDSGVAGSSDQIDDDMLFGAGNDQMECASCHDVHDSAGITNMLIKGNGSSALCLTCHNK